MSEVTSSENNSIMSENNSFDDISNPNSIESPPPPQSNVRRLSNTYSSTASSSSPPPSHNALLTDSSHELTSLPIFSSSQTNMATTFVNDPELSGLLTRKKPKFTPQAPKCAKCAKNVYMAEELRAANKTFHKLCFKCTLCNKLLEPNILTEHQGDLFCKNCYGKKFGPKGENICINCWSSNWNFGKNLKKIYSKWSNLTGSLWGRCYMGKKVCVIVVITNDPLFPRLWFTLCLNHLAQ